MEDNRLAREIAARFTIAGIHPNEQLASELAEALALHLERLRLLDDAGLGPLDPPYTDPTRAAE
jgi:hypothetical protein